MSVYIYVYISKIESCVCAQSLSHIRLCHPMTAAHQPPLSIEFPRQQYWSE